MTMLTKYQWIGGTFSVAAGLDSVTFFSKTKPNEENVSFLFPLKMSPTLIWYFTQGFKTKQSLRSYVDRSQTDSIIVNRAENCIENLAHKAAKVVNRAAKLANSQNSKTRPHRAE